MASPFAEHLEDNGTRSVHNRCMCGKVGRTCDVASHTQYSMNMLESVELVGNGRQCIECAQSGRILRGVQGYLAANDPGDLYVFVLIRKVAADIHDIVVQDIANIF